VAIQPAGEWADRPTSLSRVHTDLRTCTCTWWCHRL